MRKLAFILAAVALSAVPTLAQQPSGAWADKLFQNKIAHDFGTVAAGAQLKHSFPIKNIYAVPLTFSVRPSCGCVTYTLSKTTLQPQEQGTLDINMDGRKFRGPKSVTIYVTVGPDYVSTAALIVTANARGDVVFAPGEVNFGIVQPGQQPEVKVAIDYAGYLDWKIKEVVKPSDGPFNVTMQEVSRQPPNGKQAGRVKYLMTVKLAADAPGGVLKHDLVLKTNDPASEVMIVSVDGTVQEALRVLPKQVNFGTLKLGETKTYKVQVQGNKPFHVTNIKSDGKEISAEIPVQAAMAHTLTVRCQPLNLGEFKRTLTIFTDLDKGASVTVSIQGNAAQ